MKLKEQGPDDTDTSPLIGGKPRPSRDSGNPDDFELNGSNYKGR